jgi:hypothetical protein
MHQPVGWFPISAACIPIMLLIRVGNGLMHHSCRIDTDSPPPCPPHTQTFTCLAVQQDAVVRRPQHHGHAFARRVKLQDVEHLILGLGHALGQGLAQLLLLCLLFVFVFVFVFVFDTAFLCFVLLCFDLLGLSVQRTRVVFVRRKKKKPNTLAATTSAASSGDSAS